MTNLSLVGGTLCYGKTVVCENLNFSVKPKCFTAILGPNGCGKSTLLRSLTRSLRPRAGSVTLDGRNIYQIRPKTFAKQVAFLPQNPLVPTGITVRDLVARGRHPYHTIFHPWSHEDTSIVEQALEKTSVTEIATSDVAELSGGQRQRAWVAMVIAQNTQFVLLDEPTTFLDVAYQIDVLELIKSLVKDGITVVAVLHDLTQAARYADHVVVMDSGSILTQGPPKEVLTPSCLAEVFGINAYFIGEHLTINGRSRR